MDVWEGVSTFISPSMRATWASVTSRCGLHGLLPPVDTLRDPRQDGTFLSVATEYEQHFSRQVAASASAAGRPSMTIRFGQDSALIGPYSVPGESACLDCLLQRLDPTRGLLDLTLVDQWDGDRDGLRVEPETLLIGMIWCKWLLQRGQAVPQERLLSSLVVVDTSTPGLRYLPVQQVPACGNCRLGEAVLDERH